MQRIQFFPSVELERALSEEAAKRGCSKSALIQDILSEFFHIGNPSIAALETTVLDELADYVLGRELSIIAGGPNVEFDLLSASASYAAIPMSKEGKPSSDRARIGKVVNKKFRTDFRFRNVVQVKNLNGTVKKSYKNRAALYRINENTITKSTLRNMLVDIHTSKEV